MESWKIKIPKPNANRDFQMQESVTTEHERQNGKQEEQNCRRLPPVMALGLQLRRPDKKPYPALYLYFKTNMKDKLLLCIVSLFVLYTIIIRLVKVLFESNC